MVPLSTYPSTFLYRNICLIQPFKLHNLSSSVVMGRVTVHSGTGFSKPKTIPYDADLRRANGRITAGSSASSTIKI
jgi:hypothetical protein